MGPVHPVWASSRTGAASPCTGAGARPCLHPVRGARPLSHAGKLRKRRILNEWSNDACTCEDWEVGAALAEAWLSAAAGLPVNPWPGAAAAAVGAAASSGGGQTPPTRPDTRPPHGGAGGGGGAPVDHDPTRPDHWPPRA